MDSCSKFLGNLERNPGEIPHIGWKFPRVFRVNTLKVVMNGA